MTTFSLALRRTGADSPDLQILGGRLVVAYDADAARDRIFTALSTQLGEWYLDAEDGVPYMGADGILGGKKTEAEVAALIRRRIALDPDVDRVVDLSVIQNSNRSVSVTAQVLLTFGETITVSV
jgi:hypothetical protein